MSESLSKSFERIVPAIEGRRTVRASFRFPLGIVPAEPFLPDEGYTVSFLPAQTDEPFGDRYAYSVVLSAEKIRAFFCDTMALFDRDSSVIIERLSDDVNREKDIFIGKPMPPGKIRQVYERFEPVWLECGFVGFGMLDNDRGFETFLNDHKIIDLFVPLALRQKVDGLLARHRVECAENPATSFRYEHWHYPLSTIVHDATPGCEEPFDYYDIVNDLKDPLDLDLSPDEAGEITVPPRWWHVSVSAAAGGDHRELLIDYYLVAETEEEMETLIDCDLECRGITAYRIYDQCNVNPADVDAAAVAFRKKTDFASARNGIWGHTKPEFRKREKGRFPFWKKV